MFFPLLAQAAETASEPLWAKLLQRFADEPGLLIGLVAVVGGFAYVTVLAVLHHKERIAMIENGMHPDAEAPSTKKPA